MTRRKNEKQGNYEMYFENSNDEVRRKQAECEHKVWVKKCSCCRFIIESEKTHEDCPPDEIYI